MASIGHVAIGLAAGRLYAAPPELRGRLIPAMAAFSALSLLPDAELRDKLDHVLATLHKLARR